MNKIAEHENYCTLFTRSGKEILIDKSDCDRIKQYVWYIRNGYAAAHINGKTYYLHRIIMNAAPHDEIDHVNHNKLDDRRLNLRACTHGENAANRMKSSGQSSRFKGVVWDKWAGKYKAEIELNQKLHHLGRFDNEIDAAKAYNRAAIQCFGEFAKLNVV